MGKMLSHSQGIAQKFQGQFDLEGFQSRLRYLGDRSTVQA